MSSKYNHGDRYIDEPESGEPYQDTAQGGARNAGGQNGRTVEQLSAEEIAAVLAETYFGGRVAEKEERDENNGDSHSAEEMEASEREREARRRKRVQEMRRRKKRQELMRRLMLPCAAVFAVCVVLSGIGINRMVRKHRRQQNASHKEIVLNVDSTEGNNQEKGLTGDSALIEESSDVGGVDESIADTDNSNNNPEKNSSKKEISYAGDVNIAGCYVGSFIADTFTEELALADTLIVRTLGGRSSEPPLAASAEGTAASLDSEVLSENVVFIDVEAGRILGQRGANTRIPPASMTKILTVLVAAEHITDSDDIFVITQEIIDYNYINKCSSAGFEVGEKVTVNDLFYGTALPSGGEAAVALAVYVAGSQEAFVGMMNDKLEELGLSGTTHFTNCVGIYEENHYSTVYDMAVILKAAYDNSYCREVLGARTYKTSATEQHPEGLDLSNLFLRRIEDKDTHGEVLCAKTGYVKQSGNCAASLGTDKDGKVYICVTAHSNDPWLCIYDHVALYQQFLPE